MPMRNLGGSLHMNSLRNLSAKVRRMARNSRWVISTHLYPLCAWLRT